MVEQGPEEVCITRASPFAGGDCGDAVQIEESVGGIEKSEGRVAFNVEAHEGMESMHSKKMEKKKIRKAATAKIRARRDIVWQENPDRILKYRANHLHYYGWIPFVMFRNIKATVFSDVYIHFQTVVLVSWVAVLHLTGLSLPDDDLKMFIKLFGTPWAGSILNLGMVMVFILGLFISLVINRWSTIRQAYGQLRGTTLDLCMTLASAIESQHPSEVLELTTAGLLSCVTTQSRCRT